MPSPSVREMSLRAAVSQWQAGELFMHAEQRVRVHATCERATRMTVDQGAYEGDVELVGDDGFVHELSLDGERLMTSLYGQAADAFSSDLGSEDKATRKAAKATAKAVNAQLHGLRGFFALAAGTRGLTVMDLPAMLPALSTPR